MAASNLLGSASTQASSPRDEPALPFSPRDEDVHLTRPEAGRYLRVSTATLERWATLGVGPEMRRAGRRVLYPLSGLRRFAGVTAA
jgi:hypothetical protein